MKAALDQALADFNEALKHGEVWIGTFHARAQVLEAQGQPERAMADLVRALEFEPRTLLESNLQADAQKRLERLKKSVTCRGAGSVGTGATCL